MWVPSLLGVTLGVVVFATTFVVPVRADDVFWHLRVGELIVTEGAVPRQNRFSFSAAAHPWVAHEWLAEVALYGARRAAGDRGLVLLAVLLNALACAGAGRLVLRRAGSPLAAAAVTLGCGLLLLGNFALRPYLFGNVALIALLALLEEPRTGGRARPALLLGLFALWANLHGSVALGLAVAAAYLVLGGRSGWRGRGLDLGVALAGALLTPHHVHGLLLPLAYARQALGGGGFVSHIREWQPVALGSAPGVLLATAFASAVLAVALSRTRPRAVHLALGAAAALLGFSGLRHAGPAALLMTPLLARHLPPAGAAVAAWLGRGGAALARADAGARDVAGVARLWPAAALLVVAAAGAPVAPLTARAPAFYPRGLVAHLVAHPEGRLFHHLDWGGALIHGAWPAQPVFIDARNDCYPAAVWADYLRVHRLEPGWREALDRWRVEAIAYPRGSELAAALRDDAGWVAAFEDEQVVLFRRR
ncbi:MAG TPA: hypothetical protein VGQ83_30905 [Polyangia bacterium]|jgi:hypothetical protein